MKVHRYALAIAISGLVAAVPAAHAAQAKPSCLMLTDGTGDAKVAGQGSSYAADDIVSADVATGKKSLVGVLRLASGDVANGFPTGDTYTLTWRQTHPGKGAATMPRLSFYVYATGGVAGELTLDSTPGVTSSTVPAAASISRDGVITWTVSRKAAELQPGAKLSALTAASRVAFNYHGNGGDTRGSYIDMDDAAGSKSYVDRQPSCVRAS